ncbi:MAG: hypothetical protein ABW123_24175 [Cystobacter sp.]
MAFTSTLPVCFVLSSLLWAGAASAQTQVPREATSETELQPPEKESGEASKPPPPQAVSDVPSYELGGIVRFNYAYRSWQSPEQRSRGGDLTFDTFTLRPRAQYKNLSLRADYRFASSFHFLRFGYLSYKVSDTWEFQAGLTPTPFGILPLPAFNWFDNLTFYVGLEDEADLGVKTLLKWGGLDLQLAFYKSDEGSFFGKSVDSSRYGFDLVRTNDSEVGGAGNRTDRESSQGNVRLAYTFEHAPSFKTEVGASVMAGGVTNLELNRTGWRWAAAAHVNGQYGPVTVHLQAVSYAFHLAGPLTQDRRFVVMGAFDAAYKVASRAHLLIANISYMWPVARWPVDSVVCYNDHALMLKPEEGFSVSRQNVTGCHLAAGPIHVFAEVIAGLNHPFLGGDMNALAWGREDATWGFRPNLSVGYYF